MGSTVIYWTVASLRDLTQLLGTFECRDLALTTRRAQNLWHKKDFFPVVFGQCLRSRVRSLCTCALVLTCSFVESGLYDYVCGIAGACCARIQVHVLACP